MHVVISEVAECMFYRNGMDFRHKIYTFHEKEAAELETIRCYIQKACLYPAIEDAQHYPCLISRLATRCMKYCYAILSKYYIGIKSIFKS